MYLRRFASRYLWIALTVCFVAAVDAQEAADANAEANRLFVHAVNLYREAEARADDATPSDYVEVKDIFDRLIDEFPGSRPAAAIRAGGSPGGVNLARLAEMSERVGLKDVQRAVVRDLLAAYGGDVARLGSIADAAHYAAMSWAAYGTVEAFNAADRLGWKETAGYPEELLEIGDAKAVMFTGPDGLHVLAFRGTAGRPDWVTNIPGTLSPTPLFNQQVSDALTIAQEAVRRYPDVVFAGHSLGGRLAQAASMETGRPAFGFNSAPVGYNELRTLGFSALQYGPITRYRSPEDILSGIFSPSDRVVANIKPTGADPTFALLNLDYTHAAGVIARAMLEVRTARDEGWLAAYLREQDRTSDVSSQSGNFPTADAPTEQEWGPDIVAPEGFEPEAHLACLQQEFAVCLRSAGFSEAAIDFTERGSEDVRGSVVMSFQELGNVDLVELSFVRNSPQSYSFVNGSPKEIVVGVPDYMVLPGSFGDASSERALAGLDPMGGAWVDVQVVSHRQMPKGQRFVATTRLTSGCRACPIIGIAVRQFDFTAEGRLRAETMIGLMDWRGREYAFDYDGASVLRDTALAQFLLNIRGYEAGPMDGDFGARSRVALGAFQSEHCLPKTGVLDEASAEALAKNDFFSYACEENDISESLVAVETAPEADQATQPEEGASCTTIENDIARLECYDALAQGGSVEAAPAQVGFGQAEASRLESLLTFGAFQTTVDIGACVITVRDTRGLQTAGDFMSGGWSDFLGSTSNGVKTVGQQRDVVTFPLGSLDLRQTQPSERGGLTVVTESYVFVTRSRESEDFATGKIERESKTFRSYPLYTASPYDALPVFELLTAADLACRQYGE